MEAGITLHLCTPSKDAGWRGRGMRSSGEGGEGSEVQGSCMEVQKDQGGVSGPGHERHGPAQLLTFTPEKPLHDLATGHTLESLLTPVHS